MRKTLKAFDRAAEQRVQEEQFDYEGFDVTLIDITGFEADVISKNKVRGILEGVFHFEDYMGRRASTYFATEYFKTPDGIVISKAGTTIIAPIFPRVEAYFVPLEAFNRIPKGAGYEDLSTSAPRARREAFDSPGHSCVTAFRCSGRRRSCFRNWEYPAELLFSGAYGRPPGDVPVSGCCVDSLRDSRPSTGILCIPPRGGESPSVCGGG